MEKATSKKSLLRPWQGHAPRWYHPQFWPLEIQHSDLISTLLCNMNEAYWRPPSFLTEHLQEIVSSYFNEKQVQNGFVSFLLAHRFTGALAQACWCFLKQAFFTNSCRQCLQLKRGLSVWVLVRPFSAADIHSFSGAACDGDWPLQLLLTPAVDLWQRTWRERSQILSNVRPQTTQLWRTALVMWAGLRCVSAWARNCQGRAKVSGQSSHLRRILSFYHPIIWKHVPNGHASFFYATSLDVLSILKF